jgi:hypothetical protein
MQDVSRNSDSDSADDFSIAALQHGTFPFPSFFEEEKTRPHVLLSKPWEMSKFLQAVSVHEMQILQHVLPRTNSACLREDFQEGRGFGRTKFATPQMIPKP